jgi:hypothetical protein
MLQMPLAVVAIKALPKGLSWTPWAMASPMPPDLNSPGVTPSRWTK